MTDSIAFSPIFCNGDWTLCPRRVMLQAMRKFDIQGLLSSGDKAAEYLNLSLKKILEKMCRKYF